MNYSAKFDATLPVDAKPPADGLGAHSHGHVEILSVSSPHAPSDAIVVPDAHLLFNGDFKRSGVDLILSKDGHELLLHDYFKGEKRAALASPNGAHLTGDIVDALTGHVEYAQAGGAPDAAKVIGHVTKLTGSATVIRNGVSIVLNMGDNVHKGDVVQSGSGSQLGITFTDGTVFDLSSNARMVLNEMVYDPNGSGNSSLLSLVQGAFAFNVGQVANTGCLRIDTPVGSIRGRARTGGIGMLSLAALIFTVMKEVEAAESSHRPLLDFLDDDNIKPKDLELNGVVDLLMRDGRHYTLDDPGQTIVISGSGAVSVVTNSPTRMAELQTFQQAALAYYTQGNINPTSTGAGGGSSTPPSLLFSPQQRLQPINFIQPNDQPAPQNSPSATTQAAVVLPAVILETPAPSHPSPPPVLTLAVITLPIVGNGPIVGNSTVNTANTLNASWASSGFAITGTTSGVENGQTVTVTIVNGSNVAVETFTTTVANNAWSINVSPTNAHALSDGSYMVTATVSNAAGTAAPPASQNLTVDQTPPAPPSATLTTDSGSSNSDHITNVGAISLSGIESGATVEYSSNGGTTWTTSFTPVEGLNTVLVRQTDAVGNVSGVSALSFTLDTTAAAPGVALTTDSGSSSSDHITNNGALTLTGIETGALVQYSIDGGTTWTASFTPIEGPNTVLVRQTDVAGNVSGATSFSFTVDTTAAAPSITSFTVDTVGYQFAIDNFAITRNGFTFFNDNFDTAPPSAPNFPNGTSASFATAGTFRESGGQAIMDGSLAGSLLSVGTTTPFVGQVATLRTDISSNPNLGLKVNDSFAVQGQFALVLPNLNLEAYGIRLTDRLVGGPGTPPDQPGDDTIELVVRRDGGTVYVELAEFNFAANTRTLLARYALSPAAGDDQIVLTLSHDPNTQAVKASFELLHNGIVNFSHTLLNSDALHPQPNVNPDAAFTAPLFNNETWTLAQIVAYAPTGDHITADNAPTFTGSGAEAGATVTLYDSDGTTVLGTATANANGNWTITSNTQLADGPHSLTVKETDIAGNTSAASAPFTITVDTTAPTIAITTPIAGDNIVNASEAAAGFTIQGTTTDAESGQTVTVKIVNSLNVVVDTYTTTAGSGTWSVGVTAAQAQALADGSYTVKADVSDVAGNPATEAQQTIAVTVAAQNTSWSGDTVDARYLFPTISSLYHDAGPHVVPSSGMDPSGGYFLLAVSGSSITASSFAFSSYWNYASFNGFEVSDLTKNPLINGVSIDSATNMAGFGQGNITFDGRDVWVNWQGLSFNPGTVVKLDLTFDPPLDVSQFKGATGLDGSAAPAGNSSALAVADGTALTLAGTIDNSGSIAVNGSANMTAMIVIGSAILEGGGHVNLSESALNYVAGSSDTATLTNVDNTISGSGDLGNGSLGFNNAGVIETHGSHALIIDTGTRPFVNTGVLETHSGTLIIIGAASGGGSAVVNGGTVEFSAASDNNVIFAASNYGLLALDHSQDFTGHISGFSAQDRIDLGDVAFSANMTLKYVANGDNSGGALTISDGIHTADLTLLGSYAASSFATTSDGHGGTMIDNAVLPADQTAIASVGPVIATEQVAFSQTGSATTIQGFAVSDAKGIPVLVTAIASNGGSVAPADGSDFANGFKYTPPTSAPSSDVVTLTATDNDSASDTVNFVFNVAETGSNITLKGTLGNDVIFSTGNQDTLTGGGGHDQFVFAPNLGATPVQHTVTDFVDGLDKIDVRQFSNISASTMPTETQQGSDTLIILDNNDTLLLKNVLATNLHASDFIVHA